MSMVCVNKLNMTVDGSFFDRYAVFRTAVGKGAWQKLDLLNTRVQASAVVVTDKGKALFILTEASSSAQVNVRDILDECGISYQFLSKAQAEEIPLKLILSAACRSRGGKILSGRLFLFDSGVAAMLTDRDRFSFTIPEIRVGHDGVINVHNVTFIKVDCENEHCIGGSPVYTVADGDMKRQYKPPYSGCFYIHGVHNHKAKPVKLLDTEDGFKYTTSRDYIIKDVVTRANALFAGSVTIYFDRVCSILDHSYSKSIRQHKEEIDRCILERFQDLGVHSDIPEIFRMYPLPVGEDVAIKLIDTKEEYGERNEEDAHKSSLSIQHVTRRKLAGLKDTDGNYKLNRKKTAYASAVAGNFRKWLVELAIKQDILCGEERFGMSAGEITVIERMAGAVSFFAHRAEDGALTFGTFYENGIDLPGCIGPHIEEVLNLDEDKVIIHAGRVYGLKDTSIMPMASDRTMAEIIHNGGKVRNAKMRSALFGGVLDAHIYLLDGHVYYYAYIPGKEMKRTIDKAWYFVELVGADPGEDFSWLFDSVCVTYVGVGDKYSKYPYLFKYLDEWKKCSESSFGN